MAKEHKEKTHSKDHAHKKHESASSKSDSHDHHKKSEHKAKHESGGSSHKGGSHEKGSHKDHDHKSKDQHASHAGSHKSTDASKNPEKVSHISRTPYPASDQGGSPWTIVAAVLAVLLFGSLLTGGFSDWSLFSGMNTWGSADRVSTSEFDLDGAYAKGSPDAPVTIIEYSDFQCPFCARFYSDTLPQIEREYVSTGEVRFVYKHFPLSMHQNANKAAEASECAGDQGSFFDMHDMLFDRQSQWSNANDAVEVFVGYAEDLGLDAQQFRTCLESGMHADKVQSDLQEGSDKGVRGTPGFFVNGQMISGAQPFSVFREAIENALAGEEPTREPSQPSEPASEIIELSRDQVTGYHLGSEDADVVILEWSSYHCPFCARHHTQTMPSLESNYIETGEAQLYYHDFDFQPKSKIAATAARCAGEQVDYFEYQKLLYNNQQQWAQASDNQARDHYTNYAEQLGADTQAFTECYDSDRYADEIAAESALGRQVGVTGTPTFLIGNFQDGFIRVVGAQPLSAFEQAIDQVRS